MQLNFNKISCEIVGSTKTWNINHKEVSLSGNKQKQNKYTWRKIWG